MRFGKFVVAGLVTLASGCDSYSTGIVWKRARGSLRNPIKFKIRENIPFQRIQGNKKINEQFDLWSRVDLISGQVEATPLDVWADGHWEPFGAGLSYYPFPRDSNPNFSFDIGANFDHISADMKGRIGPVSTNVHDSIWAWGGNAGATVEWDISSNTSFVVSGGYSLTDNYTNRASADFDGPYWFAGIKVSLP